MPELPDVAIFRTYFNSTSLHKKIDEVELHGSRLFKTPSPQLKKALKGHAFTETDRHGKYLFARLDDGRYMVLHFGMTGYLEYFENNSVPEYSRMLIRFENGYSLAYNSIRKLGKVMIVDNKEDFLKQQELGPDALELSKKDFIRIMKAKRGMIKTALMDQGAIAGLGNVYSDEILFHEKLHPETSIDALDEKALGSLYDTMKRILEAAIYYHVETDEYPDTFLIPHREEDGICPRCNGRIAHKKIGGRSAWFCPSCQKKPG